MRRVSPEKWRDSGLWAVLKAKPEEDIDMAAIKIKGMTCNHCVMRVTKTLQHIEGIKNVKVDLTSGEATFDETKPVDRNTIADEIRKAGYDIADSNFQIKN